MPEYYRWKFLQNSRSRSWKAANYEIMKIYPAFSSSPSYFLQGMWANGKGDGKGGKEVWIFLMSLFNARVTFSLQRQTSKAKPDYLLFHHFLCLPPTFHPLNFFPWRNFQISWTLNLIQDVSQWLCQIWKIVLHINSTVMNVGSAGLLLWPS